MCKVIIISDASKIVDFEMFSKFCADILSGMPDGYGYAAQGVKGLFGFRTLSPELYAYDVEVPSFCQPQGETFGVFSEVNGAAMFHGRMSTNTIDLLNTHPINRDGWSLIHNGVVTHHSEKYKMCTTNDSEHVLYNLINGGIDAMGKNLTGYYAGGAIDPDGRLHVFRDAIANLFYAYSESLNTPIFATTKELINEIGEYINEELIPIKVKDNTYLIYDGNKLIEHKEFISRGYDNHSAKLSSKSLGYNLESNNLSEYNEHSDLTNDESGVNSDDGPINNYILTEDEKNGGRIVKLNLTDHL